MIRSEVLLHHFPIEDVDGRRVVDRPVVTDGPDAYFSDLPIKTIVAGLQHREGDIELAAGALD